MVSGVPDRSPWLSGGVREYLRGDNDEIALHPDPDAKDDDLDSDASAMVLVPTAMTSVMKRCSMLLMVPRYSFLRVDVSLRCA
jgi:hypothetical protein